MADVMQQSIDLKNGGNKRKPGKRKGKTAKKKQRMMMRPQGAEKKTKIDPKMKKLFRKRARDYDSDDEDEDNATGTVKEERIVNNRGGYGAHEFEEDDDGEEEEENVGFEEVSEDKDGGITKFAEGINAFRLAFRKIVRKGRGDDDVLGPVLSVHKKLVAKKLAEEEEEKKVKGEVKKEKHVIGEKGHVKPETYLDAHEKYLIGIATKGVVKLFNAVNKAQNAQKGLNPSRSKDEKVIKKRRKEAFFSELRKTSSDTAGTTVKVGTSGSAADSEAPGWAPLRDNYMLTNPKLKDWDKMQDTNDADDLGGQSDSDASSSDGD